MRKFLIENGCEIRFDTQVESLLIKNNQVQGVRTEHGDIHSDKVILAFGHSAEEMLHTLLQQGVHIEGKSFAMGLRIEHPQKLINKIQYRDFAEHPKLGSANYKLTFYDEQTKEGIYSFCMCPGGYVLSSGTESNRVVCNGMSNYHRNSPFANAAIVISIDHQKHFGSDPLGGLKLRQELEEKAFLAVQRTGHTHQIPAQRVTDFIAGKKSEVIASSSPSGVSAVNFKDWLPPFMYENLLRGLQAFDQKMKGFISKDSQFHGVESRTSSPVRITRNESYESISHQGLYPCGEGAGYAGGITSAAVDGVKIADQIMGF
jgi:uncharacterized FAD-dependent dehydrogenase